MKRTTTLLLGFLVLLAGQAQAGGNPGLRTGQVHHVVVSSSPTQGLEEGIPRTSHYARGIESDIRGKYGESFRAYLKARREFERLTKKRPAWARAIRGWIAKAEFQAEQSRILRKSRYFQNISSQYPRYHRTAAKHNKWLAIRAYTGRSLRNLANEIIAEYKQIIRRTAYDQRSRLALAAFYHELGRHADGRRTFARARNIQSDYLAKDVAYYYAAAGNFKLALQYLKTAVRYRPSSRKHMLRSNDYDRLRSDPRFRALVGEP